MPSAGPDASTLLALGRRQLAEGRGEEAVTSCRAAVALDPQSAVAHRDLGHALARMGRLSEALAEVRTALGIEPRYIRALWLLTQLKTFSAGDADLEMLEVVAADGKLEGRDQIDLHFILAKALEDAGEYRRSFEHLVRANALKRATFDYDVGAAIRGLARVEALFQPALLERFDGAGADTERPILIVGMPRSGTSLVEQILASHPDAHGSGERRDLAEIAETIALLSGGRDVFPEGLEHLQPQDLARLGHGYAARLALAAPGSPRVIDKNPFNFAYLGLAWLTVPRARVIHCLRDPVDTCLSCFKVDFERVRFAFDLEELGRYHRAYAHMMDHWRRVLPENWILNVHYEELVADLAGQTRRMLAHCGLDWDDRCLDFHSTERIVRTASFAQVRRPVYSHSVDRWRDYEPWLEPLLTALGR